MKTHLLVRGKVKGMTACGKYLSESTYVLDGVTCQACLSTKLYTKLRANSNVASAKLEERYSTMSNPLSKMVDSFNKMSAALSPNQVRKGLGMDPICRQCREPVRMMTMIGTDFCSPNCQELHETLNAKEK